MALKQVTPTRVTVGDMDFYIRPFAAFKAANITGELAGVLAPVLGVLAPLVSDTGKAAEDENGESILDQDAGKAAAAMANCPSISGSRLEKLMQALLLGGHISFEIEEEDGNKDMKSLTRDQADEIFCGNVQDMFVLCYHVIRLNYNGFFAKLPTLSGKAKLPAAVRKIL
ncbi:MAG: hypothetical protein HFI14_09040 [Lachnospiraceae bacterium]|nr:hypothetical protein [Lachnospiraceae bacterium]